MPKFIMVKDQQTDQIKYYKKIKKTKPPKESEVIKQGNKSQNFNPKDLSFKQNTKVIWDKLLKSNEKEEGSQSQGNARTAEPLCNLRMPEQNPFKKK